MQKLILNTSAFVLEGVGAYMAAPVAMELWGAVPGLVLSGCLGLAIYYAWYSAINGKFKGWKNWFARPALVAVALSLLAVSSVSIHTAKNLDTIKTDKAEREARQAKIDSQYQKALDLRAEQIRKNAEIHQLNEQARLSALARINAEIKATKKLEQPELFTSLLERQTELSIPHLKAADPDMPIKAELPQPESMTQTEIIEAVQAGGFTVIVPILLMLAKLSGSGNGNAPARSFVPFWTRSVRPKSSNVHPYSSVQFSETGTGQCDPDMQHFAGNNIPADDMGKVTTAAIQDYFECGRRKAETLRDQALSAGLLVNRSNCYYYTYRKPVSQPQKTAEVRHLHAVGQ